MRARLWEHYARALRPGPGVRLLDIAAGTGSDALHLARLGAEVVAVDVSDGMLGVLRRRAAERQLSIETRHMPAERLGTLDPGVPFDGALTAFAGLNTIDDLPRFAYDLAGLLKPGGRVVIHALNAFCVWETVNQVLHGQRPRARHTRAPVGEVRFYDPVRLWREVFAARFACREVYALSVAVAPGWLRRAPRIAPASLRLDGWLGRRLPRAGDFFVLDLEKR
jgi:SAM-dependent methyltransferase